MPEGRVRRHGKGRSDIDRGRFLSNSAGVLSSLAYAESDGYANGAQDPGSAGTRDGQTTIGRPARVSVSVGFRPGPALEEIVSVVEREAARGTDLIALPETFRGQNDLSFETLDGPTISALAPLAVKHRTYIVAPIDRKDGDRRFNSAVVLDRRGRIAGVYDKMYPYWVEELDRIPRFSRASPPR